MLPQRAVIYARIKQQAHFDLIIIGGGATGLGTALDASLRGYSVALLEAYDFASGTSSRSSKLFHGGVRYLAQGNLALVREALRERSQLLAMAPHLAQPLAFVMPSYKFWQTPYYGMGLKLYDLLAQDARLHPTEFLSRQQTLQALQGLKQQGLYGGVCYWDGQFEDARFALALARSAEKQGAHVINYMKVQQIKVNQQNQHTHFSVHVIDTLTGSTLDLSAGCVINASGIWVDQVRNQTEPSSVLRKTIKPSQGTHIVLDRSYLNTQQALLIPKTRDGRVLFIIPWLGKLILGTTDIERETIERDPVALDEEIDFILSEAAEVLEKTPTRKDILSQWTGLRPLVGKEGLRSTSTEKLSREHHMSVEPNRLVNICGGKWTTFRVMARDVLSYCVDLGLLVEKKNSSKQAYTLHGYQANLGNPVPLYEPAGLHLYGSEQSLVESCAQSHQELAQGLSEAMVRYAVRHEFANTVEDILARRSRLLFLDAKTAKTIAPKVAQLLQEEGITDTKLVEFCELCNRYLP